MTLLSLPSPLDVSASLELFRRSGDDLIDRWDGTRLIRVVSADGRSVPFVAMSCGTLDAPAFTVSSSEPAVLEAVRTTFTPAPGEYGALLRSDPVLARLDAQFPGIRQIRQLDLFTALIRCISAQQVNLRWAVTTRRRLAETFGIRHEVDGECVYSLDPVRLACVEPLQIRALQFTMSKSEFIVAVARAIAEGTVRQDDLSRMGDDEVIAKLSTIRGIGRWSAEWVLARTLGRPRVVAGDLGVRKAVGLAYLGTPLPSENEVRRATDHWGPAAGVAQALVLHALGERALLSS